MAFLPDRLTEKSYCMLVEIIQQGSSCSSNMRICYCWAVVFNGGEIAPTGDFMCYGDDFV